MKKFLVLIIASYCLISWNSPSGINFVGTWKSYLFEPFSKTETVTDSLKENFHSEIIFYADSTFLKTTNGVQLKGRYESTENTLTFYVLGKKNKYVRDYIVRWPHGQTDPHSPTPEIDFSYQEVLPVKNKEGKMVMDDVFVYYKKAE